MFQITDDPSSGRLTECLAKITCMDLSCLLTWTGSVLWQLIVTRSACVQFTVYEGSAFLYSELHTRIAPHNMLP